MHLAGGVRTEWCFQVSVPGAWVRQNSQQKSVWHPYLHGGFQAHPQVFLALNLCKNGKLMGRNWAMEPKTRWRNAPSQSEFKAVLAVFWVICGEFAEGKDEEAMTSSAPAVGWSEGSSHSPKWPESHPVCGGEEKGKAHIRKGHEREAPGSKEFQHEFYFVYPLVKLFVTSIIHRKWDHFSLSMSN